MDYYLNLIAKRLSRTISPSEDKLLETWLNQSAENRTVFEQFRKIWHDGQYVAKVRNQDEAYEKIAQKLKLEEPLSRTRQLPVRGKSYNFWWGIAAVIILALGIAGVLTLDVFHLTNEDKPAIAMITKSNPSGQKSNFRLPDGTKVWLNAASQVTYPKVFSETQRLVKLEGEGYFEVAKKPEKPFIVSISQAQIQALGTTFNINAYAENKSMVIALLEGKVKIDDSSHVQTAYLTEGEELSITRDSLIFTKGLFDYAATFGWKDGILIFDGDNFLTFKHAIEKWYGVQVTTQGTIPEDWDIRAQYKNESLENVLEDISFNKEIQFVIDQKKVVLTFK